MQQSFPISQVLLILVPHIFTLLMLTVLMVKEFRLAKA